MELNNTKYRAAIYLRFSKEEDAAFENKQNSNSTLNQRKMRDLLKTKSNINVVPIRAEVENLRVSFNRPELQVFQNQSARLWGDQ